LVNFTLQGEVEYLCRLDRRRQSENFRVALEMFGNLRAASLVLVKVTGS
jgi:hypothetical protein